METVPVLEQVVRRPTEVRAPGEPFADAKRILFARIDRLGDLVLSLPALALVRATYPEATLGLLVDRAWGTLAPLIRGVDTILPIDPGAAGRMQALAEFRPDLILCVSRGKELAWAARMSRIANRVGSGRRFYSALFNRTVDETRRHGERHELEYALSFAHRIGAAAAECSWPLEIQPESDEAIRDWANAADVDLSRAAFLHLGSGGSCPRWPLRRWLELGRHLRSQGYPVILGLGPNETEWNRKLDADPDNAGLLRFDGSLSLLAALVSRVGLVAGNSTGPIHLAAAMGARTLAIHAPWTSCGVARWGPYSPNGWTMTASHPDAAEWTREQRRTVAGGLMAALQVESVAPVAVDLLEGRSPRRQPSQS